MAALMDDRGQWIIIIDLDDYSVRMAGSGNLRYCKSIADVDAKHYPERCAGLRLAAAYAASA